MIKAIGGFSATDQPVTKSLTIEKRIESISVSPDPIEVEVGQTAAFQLVILPADATNKNLNITVSNTDIAAIVNGNSINGRTPGITELIVKTTDGSKLESRVRIIVKDPYIGLEEIKFKKPVFKLNLNEKIAIESVLIFNPDNATNKEIVQVASTVPGCVAVKKENGKYYLVAEKVGYSTVTAEAEEQRDKSKPKASALFEVSDKQVGGDNGASGEGRW